MLRATATFLIFALVLLGVSYLGAVHPIGDSLSVFRLWIAGGVLGLGLVVWAIGARFIAFVGVVAAIGAAGPILASYQVPQAAGQGAYMLYQKNLLFRAVSPMAIVGDIRETQPDFVTLQEVSQANRVIFPALTNDFPTVHSCTFATVGGTAVLSRWPAIEGQKFCAEKDGVTGIQVQTPSGPVWVMSVHLHWPWPHSQAQQLQRVLPLLEQLDGPFVLGGDFNMVTWSSALQRLANVTDTRPAGPVSGTLDLFDGWLKLPIDHVFTPNGGHTTTRPRLGSDHLGVLARFDLPPQT